MNILDHILLERHTFGLKRDIHFLEHLHRIRTSAFLLRVEQDASFLGHAPSDDVEQDRPERLLHVRADPDEEPVVKLSAGGEHRADTRAGADCDAAAVEVCKVGQAGKLSNTDSQK